MSGCEKCCLERLESKLDQLLVLQARQVALLEMMLASDGDMDCDDPESEPRFYLDGSPV